MDIAVFFAKVNEHQDLTGVFVDSANGVVSVKHNTTGLCTNLPVQVVEQVEWNILEDVLLCKREPEVLYHITRIVGYYSRVENWNNSKLGEMKSRIKGDYSLDGGKSNVEERLRAVDQIQNQ